MRTGFFHGILLVLLFAFAAAGGFAIYLADPGMPSPSRSLRFEGYLLLPLPGRLNVLDYMSVSGNRLYVAGMSSGSIVRISLSGRTVPSVADEAVMRGEPQTHGVVVANGIGFVTREGPDTVDLFDPEIMVQRRSLPVAKDPDGILYDPDDRLVYVASGEGKTGTFIDPAAQTIAGNVALGGQPEYPVYDAAQKQIFQNIESTNEVVSIDPAQHIVTRRWKLADCERPSGAALDEAQQRLWIACGGNSRAIVFDLAAHRILTNLPVSGHPDTIAYDSGLRRAYAAGSAGSVTVLEQSGSVAYRVRDLIKTHPLAHTLAVDPATHWVYVGYTGFFSEPRVAVFSPLR